MDTPEWRVNAVVAVNELPAGALLASLRGMGFRVWLSEDGVIRVSPRDRLTLELRSQIQRFRDGLVAQLEAERREVDQLQQRVAQMGQRWGYSLEEIEWAQAAAAVDVASWVALCRADELSARRSRQAGMSFP